MSSRLLKYLAATVSGLFLFLTLSARIEGPFVNRDVYVTNAVHSTGRILSREGVLQPEQDQPPRHQKADISKLPNGGTTRSSFASEQMDPLACYRSCNDSSEPETVVKSSRSVFLYTARLDNDANLIYAFGLSGELQSHATYYCHTWEDGSDEGHCVERAKLESVGGWQPQRQPGSALATFSCAPPANAGSRSIKLALADTDACHLRRSGGVQVQTTASAAPDRPRESKAQFAVCCLPEWDSPTEVPTEQENFVSFFEANAFYGAGRFYFYNVSSNNKHELILRRYESSGLVTIVQWPKRNDALSLMAAREDCLQRSRKEAKYVVYLSVHDLLLPLTGGRWSEVFNQTLATPAHAYRIATVLFGVPSLTHCSTRDKTLLSTVSKVAMLQHTLFRGVTTGVDDPRFYRTIYNLERTRTHPSFKPRDWHADGDATGGKPSIVSVGPLVASALNYRGLPQLSPSDKHLRFHPLKYSPLVCRHTDAIARAVDQSCGGDCKTAMQQV